MALPRKNLNPKRLKKPFFQAMRIVVVEPEFGVANESMNGQMILLKKLQNDHNLFFRNFTCQATFFAPFEGASSNHVLWAW
jgi:hypothetical protein